MNDRRDQFRDLVLAFGAGVERPRPELGSSHAERVDVLVARLSELAFLMQQNFKNEHVISANTEIPQLDAPVNEFIAEVGRHYNTASSELPPTLDYEAEGRWQPLGV